MISVAEVFEDLQFITIHKDPVAHDKSFLESNNPDEKDEADPERDPLESEPRTEATLSSSVSFFVSSPVQVSLYLQLNLSSSCESFPKNELFLTFYLSSLTPCSLGPPPLVSHPTHLLQLTTSSFNVVLLQSDCYNLLRVQLWPQETAGNWGTSWGRQGPTAVPGGKTGQIVSPAEGGAYQDKDLDISVLRHVSGVQSHQGKPSTDTKLMEISFLYLDSPLNMNYDNFWWIENDTILSFLL